MIISITPLRIPMAGGGTDLPPYCEKYGGATLSATINKYIYILVNRHHENSTLLSYAGNVENVFAVDNLKHLLVRETLKHLGLDRERLEIHSISDLPFGTGLGSSGAFTVGLLNALHTYKGERLSQRKLAEEAADIEINKLGGFMGKQDQTVCAVGGINFIQYGKTWPKIKSIKLRKSVLKRLQNRLIMFDTGARRCAAGSLEDMTKMMDERKYVLDDMKNNATEALNCLEKGLILALGKRIYYEQQCKERLSKTFINRDIRKIMKIAKDYGAYGKNTGAGIGGFIVMCCPRKKRPILKNRLSHLKEVIFKIEFKGTKVVVL
jgi:D-glycero-alpha-D-manno-heptose-7-phosphate kinase